MIINRIIPRLLLVFFMVSPIPLASLAWFYTQAFESALQTAVLENLSSLADKKADQISHYFDERLADVQFLAKSNSTRIALQSLSDPGLNETDRQAMELKFREHYQNLFDSTDFYDLLLIDVAGNVVLSILHEPDFGSNLNSGSYKDSVLAQAQRDAIDLLDSQITAIQRYAPSSNKPAGFIVTPVMDKGRVIGTVALQLDLEKLVRVATDATGLGRTGETVLAQIDQDEALYVGPLRHIPDAAFHHHLRFDQVAKPMRAALTGEHGRGLTLDYAGVEVVAVWRYLPALRWGMVIKLDQDEAFQPAYRIRQYSVFALALLLLIAGALGSMLGFNLVRPIRQLIQATGRIANGDLNQRAEVEGCDEFRSLAESFNLMADSLAEEKALLEQRVAMRTDDLQQSKLQYDQLTARIPVGVYTFRMAVDGSMRFEYVSERFCRQFGISAEMFKADAQHAFNAVHPDELDRFVQLNQEVAQTLKPFIWEGRFVVHGSAHWFRIESIPSLQDNGDSVWSGVVSDITERKQAEIELMEAKSIAEQANRAKSAFLANMSHEIRTPMNAILGLIQLVLETELNAQQADYLRKAHQSAKALLGILNDILDYSKIESGRLEIERMPLNIESVLKEVADLFGAQLEEKGLELFLDLSADVPHEVSGDAFRLKQVLDNLVGNAVKFTERGEIHIKVELLKILEGDLTLRFAVRDTGIGLTKEQANRLFQPFIQADGSITRRYGGTGLGLAICQKLVNLMGGDISVSGSEGQGATFTFTFQVGQIAKTDAFADTDALKDLKVLVVDDQETSRLMLKKLLEAWRLEAETVDSGEEALIRILEASQTIKPYDAVLLDWRMPGMNGLEVAKQLEALTLQGRLAHPLLVVMVTAHDKEALSAEACSIHLNGILTKPVLPSYLFDILVNGRSSMLNKRISQAPIPSSKQPRFEGAQILLVEDNAINQQVAAEFLKKRGVIVTLANHGLEAVEWVQRRDFDLILMDLHMPVMDGIEATLEIHELNQPTKPAIIAMTAAVMQEDRDRCLAAGMVDFVAKPIDSDELTRVLSRWLPKAQSATPLSASLAADLGQPAGLFDSAQALRRLEGDQKLLLRLLASFLEAHTDTLTQLDALLRAEDKHQARQFLHSLKGVASNLGAHDLAETAYRLEREWVSGEALNSMQAFSEALNATLVEMNAYIKAHEDRNINDGALPDAQTMSAFFERLKFFLEERELVPDDLLETLDHLSLLGAEGAQWLRLKRQIDQFDHEAALKSLAQLMKALDLK